MRQSRSFHWIGVLLVACVLPSCLTHTYTGRTHYFPEGADRANHAQQLLVTVNGAKGHAYVDRTDKTVFVTLLNRDGKILLDQDFTVVAGDLKWAARAQPDGGFESVFYEFVDVPDGDKSTVRQVLTLTYADGVLAKAQDVAEAPDWVMAEIKEKRQESQAL